MEELYIVTGAGGHLGGTIVRMLLNRSKEVRGLILPEENGVDAERLTYITVSYTHLDVYKRQQRDGGRQVQCE